MEYKVIKENKKETWYHNGNKVKKICYYENGKKSFEHYYLDDKRHNENGPAFISWYENGNKYYEEYYKNDKRHNENGPAIIRWYENGKKSYESYYLDDKLHNENGPAIISWYKNGKKYYEKYYKNGKEIKKEELSKSKKSINIGGKEVSEETILIALKNYLKFDEENCVIKEKRKVWSICGFMVCLKYSLCNLFKHSK